MILFVQDKFILARVGFVSGRTRWFGLNYFTERLCVRIKKENKTLALFYYGWGN